MPRESIASRVILIIAFFVLTIPAVAQTGARRDTSPPARSVASPAPEVPEQVDKIAEVQVKSALKVLQEGRSGVVHVIIRNLSSVPITVTKIVPTTDDPKTIIANVTGFQAAQSVPPQQAIVVRTNVSAAGQIQEGAHFLLFQVDVQWTRDNKPLTGSLFASTDFNVEVLGLSGVLSVLGASSILFLPGFLVVTVFFVLNRLWGKYTAGEKWEFGLKSPEFWMAALTVSIVAPYVYALVSRVYFREWRDYREGYGLGDVVLIWFASIILSFVIWVFYRAIRELIVVPYLERKRQALANYGVALNLDAADDPDELVDKLVRRWDWEKLSFWKKWKIIQNNGERPADDGGPKPVRQFAKKYPRYVEILVNGSAEGYFLIEPAKKNFAFIVPPIEYRYEYLPDDPPPDLQQRYNAFRDELDEEIGKPQWNVRRIVELFQQGKKNGWLTVKWGKLQTREPKVPRQVSTRHLNPRPDVQIRLFRQLT